VLRIRCEVENVGFRFEGLGFRLQVVGCIVYDLGVWAQGLELGFEVCCSRFRGHGFKV
jgi:hypothetical protein